MGGGAAIGFSHWAGPGWPLAENAIHLRLLYSRTAGDMKMPLSFDVRAEGHDFDPSGAKAV